MTVVWTPTVLAKLDEIYDTIQQECGTVTAAKWFFKVEAAAAQLADFPLLGPILPEQTLSATFPAFANLRQLVVSPYRIIYEATDTNCNILSVMRCSRLIGTENLG